MALVTLAGYAAFILASLVLGIRLVSLWRRTREWPELIIGSSFLLAGTVGYSFWLAVGVLLGAGASSETIKHVALIGLGCTVVGAIANGYGTAHLSRGQALGAGLGNVRRNRDGRLSGHLRASASE